MSIKKEKIAYIVTKSVWGGAQRYVFDLATHISKDVFDVCVITGTRGPLTEKLDQKNIRTIFIPHLVRDINFFQDILVFFSFVSIFLKESPDIIHLNSSKIGGIGALAGSLFRFISKKDCKIIFTAHGWAFHEDRPLWQKKFIVFVSRLAGYFQDYIIILSRHDLDSAIRNNFSENKLVFIPLGIPSNNSFLNPLDAEHELAKRLHTNRLARPIFGTIAELTRNKGLSYLIQAVLILKQKDLQFSCIIIGDGEEKNDLERMILKNHLEKNVFLVGFIDNAVTYLKAFDFFVLPSLKEGLPYVLLEAQAAGIPSIGTDIGGIPDIVENGKNGILVESKNPKVLAQAMEKLIRSRDIRLALASETVKKIEAFSFEQMLQKTMALYINQTK